jgi:hypothetical protein
VQVDKNQLLRDTQVPALGEVVSDFGVCNHLGIGLQCETGAVPAPGPIRDRHDPRKGWCGEFARLTPSDGVRHEGLSGPVSPRTPGYPVGLCGTKPLLCLAIISLPGWSDIPLPDTLVITGRPLGEYITNDRFSVVPDWFTSFVAKPASPHFACAGTPRTSNHRSVTTGHLAVELR